jgi:hypothetical protein
MNKMNKTGLITAVAVATAAIAPQMATAHERRGARGAAPAVSVQSALERRLAQMEQEMAAMRAELARSRAETKADVKAATAKVEAQAAQVDQKLAEATEHAEEHHDLLFFRGGYAKMEHGRGYRSTSPETLLVNKEPGDNDGWYVGAGFDHKLTDDIWGIWDGAEVDGEVMFEYKNFGTGTNTLVSLVTTETIENKITQLTLTAAPKIKFKGMGDFRPWIIPFGLGIHIISPPSSGVTVLNPGLMVGAGGEYRVWKDLYAGIDFRYHWTGDDLKARSSNGLLKGVDTDGFTTGAYLGFGF